MKENIKGKVTSRSEMAQGMVEFALTLPVLLVLFFGIMEFGRLLFTYSVVTTAAREAARYGSAAGDSDYGMPYYRSCEGIKDSAVRIGGIVGVQPGNVTIIYDEGPGSATLPSCSSSTSVELGDRIIVQVAADFQPIVPLVNLNTFTVNSIARRTILTRVDLN